MHRRGCSSWSLAKLGADPPLAPSRRAQADRRGVLCPRASALLLAMAAFVGAEGWALGASRLAIHPLRSQGTAPEAMQQLDAALRIELSRMEGLELVGGGPIDGPTHCQGETSCLAAFGRSLGAREVLYGEVRALPDSYSVSLRLIDVATATEVGRTSGSYNRDVEEMVLAARAQVARLKAPERFAGQLVAAAPLGAAMTVNGSAVRAGEALVLKPGLYEVLIRAGGAALQGWVEVRFEQSVTVTLGGAPPRIGAAWSPWSRPERVEFAPVAPPRDLEAGPGSIDAARVELSPPAAPGRSPAGSSAGSAEGPGWPRWPGYAAIAVGGLLAAGGTWELVRAQSLQEELESMRGPSGAIPSDRAAEARSKNDSISTSRTAGAALAGVGAAGLIGGVVYLFVAPAGVGVSGVF